MWRSNNLWLRSLLHSWVGRRHAPIQTKKVIRARDCYKPRVEILEERLAPTVSLSYVTTAFTNPTLNTGSLYVAASASANLTVSETSGTWKIQLTGDTFGSYDSSIFKTSGSTNTLTTSKSIANLYIGGSGTSANSISGPYVAPDTGDTVNLGPFSLGNASLPQFTGNMEVNAGTINFQGAVNAYNFVQLTSVNSLTLPQTGVPYEGSVTVNVAPPSGQPFAGDPYLTGPDWGSYGYQVNDKIKISNAGTLTSGAPSGGYNVAAIVGDNMYLAPTSGTNYSSQFATALSPNLTETITATTGPTVQCTGFTPDLTATTVDLTVTGAGNIISGALGGSTVESTTGVPILLLEGSTNNGNITLQDVPPADALVGLGNLYAGSGTIQLAVNGLVADALQPTAANPINLTASAVDLTTTGSKSPIGAYFSNGVLTTAPITTQSGVPGQSLELTATTNDGPVYIQDSSPAGLTINSVVADQGGQTATVSNGQVVYNSTPGSANGPKYVAGSNTVTIGSSGPIVLNSVSATGNVTITGQYILEGSEQSPNVTAPEVDLVATGTSEYQGQVTFAQGAGGDTLTNTGALTWSFLGFHTGGSIVISGALSSADDAVYTIQSMSGNVLTLTQSFVLTPETDAEVTVGDGMIGRTSAAVSLSDVPLFSANTADGDIYLALGNAVNSMAVSVSSGNLHGTANDVSVTSSASFLTIEDIFASGNAAVAANSGALLEYGIGVLTGNMVSLTSPYNIGTPSSIFYTGARSGLTVDATATSPTSAGIDIVNSFFSTSLNTVGVSTYDGNVMIQQPNSPSGGNLTFKNGVLSETGNAVVTFANTDGVNGSDGDVKVSGTVYVGSIVAGISANGTAGAGQILTNPGGAINGNGGALILSAASGIGTSGTALNVTNVATLGATTNTGIINVTDGNLSASTLTLSASTSAGDIDVTWKGDIDLSSEASNIAGVVLDSISAPGTVTLDAIGGAIVDKFNSTVSASTLFLTAANGIGTASAPLETTSRGTTTLTATNTTGGGLFIDSNTTLTVESATENGGNLAILAAGNLILLGQVSAGTTGNVSLTATAGAFATGNITTSAAAITTTGQKTVTPTVMEPYIVVGASLLIDNGTAPETVTVTAVTPTTFTATFTKTHLAGFTIATATGTSISPDSVLAISAGNLTITALQIGSPNDVIQTQTTTINATASDGGIYLSNSDLGNTLTLTAAAVGTASGLTANNIEIYNAGQIVLQQQTTSLTQLAKTEPIAIFCPGGALTLVAGETLSAGGITVSGSSYQTISSATPPATATITPNVNGELTQGNLILVSTGSGYKTAPTVTITGGGAGTGATAKATMSVTGLAITRGGSGYTGSTLPLTFSGGGGGTGAMGTATISNGTVVSVTITNQGSGYTSAPTWTVAGGTKAASGTATLSVNAVSITNVGSGYTSPPAVTISIVPPGYDIYTGTYDLDGYNSNINPVTSGSLYGLPSLVIVSGTAEVTPPGTGGSSVIPALITLADLTTLALQTDGSGNVTVVNGTETVATTTGGLTTVTITAAAITIDNLGLNGGAGTAIIPDGWSLVLDATAGNIVFLNLEDTIKTTGSTGNITVEAGTKSGNVAALGNLTTGGGSITVSAGGNIAIGTFIAGIPGFPASYGTISVTSIHGGILLNNGTSPNAIASQMTLTEATQPVASAQSAALAELHATEVIAAADAATANAIAAADAAGAQAAAELSTVNAIQAALTSIQAAVTADNLTYQADVQITNSENSTVNADNNTVNALTTDVSIADGIAGVAGLAAAIAQEISDAFAAIGSSLILFPGVGTVYFINVTTGNFIASTLNLISQTATVAALGYQVELNNASNQLANDTGTLASDQANEQGALAQLQADSHTEAALAAALDVAEQAYETSEKAYTNDQATSALVQAQGDANQAVAIAGVVFATPSQPLNATATSSGPVYITAQSPLTAIPITSDGPVTQEAAPDDPGTETDDLTVPNDVTLQSTGSSVTLLAGNDVDIEAGATVDAFSSISITADLNNDPSGATVTVDGTLDAPSASIGVPSNATGPETFNITPSATTQISVTGSPSSSDNTLNINDPNGLPVTISGNKITVGNLKAVTFGNIQFVDITNTNGTGTKLTLDGTSGAANSMSLVGTGQEAGTATLNGVAFSFSGMTSFGYTGGSSDTIAVTPFATLPWNLAVTVAGGSSVSPSSLTYYAATPNVILTATGNEAGSVVEKDVETVPFSNVSQVTISYHGILNVEKIPDLTVTDAGGTFNGTAFPATAQINGSASLDGITPTLTYYRGSLVSLTTQLTGAPLNGGTYTVVANFPGDATYATASASTNFTIARGTPQVSITPVTLTYGTALADGQLKGTATYTVKGASVTVGGTYTYTPAEEDRVLNASGTAYSENVTFTPTDTTDYNSVSTTVSVTVNKATPSVSFNPVPLTYGTALANSQLGGTATFVVNGTSGTVGGTYAYTPAEIGTVLKASSTAYSENVTFTPNDTIDYNSVSTTVNVTVSKATPIVSVNPVPLTYGTALANSQLGGTATFTVNGAPVTVGGIYAYTAAEKGTVLNASGTAYSEYVTFTPTDTTDYNPVSTTVSVTVSKATPSVAVNAVTLTSGTALANSQLGGTATYTVNGTKVNVPGTYSYTSAAGTLLASRFTPYTEAVTFTPNDTVDYVTQTNLNVMVTVTAATPELGGVVSQIVSTLNHTGANAGGLDVFGIGGDHALYVNSQSGPGGTFSGWSSLGGYVKQITVGTQKNGALAVFAIGGDNAAYVMYQNGDGSWTPGAYTDLHGYVTQLAVGTNANGALELFGIGGDNGVWDNVQSTANTPGFGGWSSLGGYVTQITVGTNYNGTNAYGNLQVFGIGGDHGAWFRQESSPGTFGIWTSLGGYVQQLAVGLDLNHHLELFGIGGDNAIWVTTQGAATPTGFSNWSSLGGYVTQISVTTDQGDLDVFGIGGDSAIWYRKQDPAIGLAFDPYVRVAASIAQLSAVTDNNGNAALFAIGKAFSDGQFFD